MVMPSRKSVFVSSSASARDLAGEEAVRELDRPPPHPHHQIRANVGAGTSLGAGVQVELRRASQGRRSTRQRADLEHCHAGFRIASAVAQQGSGSRPN